MDKRFFIACIGSVLLLSACSNSDEPDQDIDLPEPQSAEVLYNDARDLLSQGKAKLAIDAFGDVEQNHPSSPWATHAMVMSAFSSYRAEEYDQAISTAKRFVKLYPDNESTPYAYYLIA